jgi:cytochrome c peroxidase
VLPSDPPGYNCFTCHIPETGGTSGPSSVVNLFAGPQPGVRPGRISARRPQTYTYAAFSPIGPFFDADFAQAYIGGTFWNGRTPDLAGQAHQPFMDPNEMANIPTNGIYPGLYGGYSARVVDQAINNWGPQFGQAFYPGILKESTAPRSTT